MEKCDQTGEPNDAIVAFDILYTTNHTQMLKLLFPYLVGENRNRLAVYIKLQEFIYTLNISQKQSLFDKKQPPQKEVDLSSLLPLLSPYCSESEKNMLTQFSRMQEMMKTYQNIVQYLPMIQEMMGAFSPAPSSNADDTDNLTGSFSEMTDILRSMLSEEQQSLFSLFMEGGSHDP